MVNMQNKASVTLIIPAKNEQDGIAQLINESKRYVNEIIVVDGHSADLTSERAAAQGAHVIYDNCRGKGDAYKVGIQQATGEIIVFMDADGSHSPHDIPVLIKPITDAEADFVIGSRYKGGSDEWRGDLGNYIRTLGNGILTLAINYRWRSNLTECLNGFRAIRRSTALQLKLKADDFDIEQHMIVQCLKQKLRVQEVAAHEYCRKWGASKLPTYRKAYIFFWRLFLDLLNL